LIKINLKRARKAQKIIASKIILKDLFKKPVKFVGGVDVAFSKEKMIGAAVVLNYPNFELCEYKVVKMAIKVPYIPTFLAFREAPVMMKAVKSLRIVPDLLLVDANGILHPLKAGEASHIGVVLNMPTIGVAKSLLCGTIRKINGRKAIFLDDEIVGFEVQIGKKKLYISPGHGVSLNSSLEYALKYVKNGHIEPLRQAHLIANRAKRTLN